MRSAIFSAASTFVAVVSLAQENQSVDPTWLHVPELSLIHI